MQQTITSIIALNSPFTQRTVQCCREERSGTKNSPCLSKTEWFRWWDAKKDNKYKHPMTAYLKKGARKSLVVKQELSRWKVCLQTSMCWILMYYRGQMDPSVGGRLLWWWTVVQTEFILCLHIRLQNMQWDLLGSKYTSTNCSQQSMRETHNVASGRKDFLSFGRRLDG